MDGRINIYKTIRRIHLYSAMVVMVFLVMYFVSGFLMTRHSWFGEDTNSPVTTDYDLDLSGITDPEEIAGIIRERFDIPGKNESFRQNPDGSLRLDFLKPGLTTTVNVSSERNIATVTVKKQEPYRVISVFHRLHGYGGGSIYDVYIVMMDLASLSLLIFAVSGLYLWLKILKNKTWGIIFLVAGIIYTLLIFLTFTYY